MVYLLTNNKFFAILNACQHCKCVCKGKQNPAYHFQRVFVWCENIMTSEDNSSPEQFRRIFELRQFAWGCPRRFALSDTRKAWIGEQLRVGVAHVRRRKRVSPVTEKPRWKRRGKADNGLLSKRVVPRVSYNFVSFAEDFLLQKGFFVLWEFV